MVIDVLEERLHECLENEFKMVENENETKTTVPGSISIGIS